MIMETSSPFTNENLVGLKFRYVCEKLFGIQEKWKKSVSKAPAVFADSKVTCNPSPHLNDFEILPDPSFFMAYAFVRQHVLRNHLASYNKFFNLPNEISLAGSETDKNKFSNPNLNEEQQNNKAGIPQAILISLRSIYSLLKECSTAHPSICHKVLEALFEVLQNLSPECLIKECPDALDPLFQLLLELSSITGTHPISGSADVQSIPSLASSCLISLVIAWGLTPKLLQAINSLITTSGNITSQSIQLPTILQSLQKEIRYHVNQEAQTCSWFAHGVLQFSIVSNYAVFQSNAYTATTLCCDGDYLYLLTDNGLQKLGTGLGGTANGRVYLVNSKFKPPNNGTLVFAQEQLFLLHHDDSHLVALRIDRHNLIVQEHLELLLSLTPSPVFFSDGNCIGAISKSKDDQFCASFFRYQDSEIVPLHEEQFSMTLECMRVLGYSVAQESPGSATLSVNPGENIVGVTAAKEFTLLWTASGKVFCQGKPTLLGLKTLPNDVPLRANGMYELPLHKNTTIVECAAGHEGLHGILIDADGAAHFVGIARRGEDGDPSKQRKHPKPSRPKRVISMEGKYVVHAACNNGSSAFVTRSGELHMFGKDSTYCELGTGRVMGLKDARITYVCLGKAHALALTENGEVYSFGMNNKGQCGRDVLQSKRFSSASYRDAPSAASLDGNDIECANAAAGSKTCAPTHHRWIIDQCMICTHCNQCTGYGSGCINTNVPGRLPGSPCGCGSGEAGCSACGLCRPCARVQRPDAAAFAVPPFVPASMMPEKFKNLDEMEANVPPLQAPNELGPNYDASLAGSRRQRRQRQRLFVASKFDMAHQDVNKSWDYKAAGSDSPLKGLQESSHEKEGTTSKLASLPPGTVKLPNQVSVVQIACGLHHSVLLTADGNVYTFGSNNYGQLGVGDLSARSSPTLVKLPTESCITMVAAGSHHTVVMTKEGEVISWGSYCKGQLGRDCPESDSFPPGDSIWHALPGFVKGIDSKMGKRACWIGASGDQTFIKLSSSLISDEQFASSSIIASDKYFLVLPASNPSIQNLVISRKDGKCRSFSGNDQIDFTEKIASWDPNYGILWSFDKLTGEISGYNVLAHKVPRVLTERSLCASLGESNPVEMADIFRPPFCLPILPSAKVTRAQAALYLLCSLDTLTSYDYHPNDSESSPEPASSKDDFNKEDFSVANRFESHGGGWGYSSHSIEAIRFSPDTDIILGGFSLFGGRGEYMGKIKVYDLGPNGGEQEADGELLAESEEVIYECGARQRFPITFRQPVLLQANRWYLAWARVNGPSSDCGSGGLSTVVTDDQVTFNFKTSKKSNNGTDVNAGQIPEILYRAMVPDVLNSAKSRKTSVNFALSPSFSKTITQENFPSLISLIMWSWSAIKEMITESPVKSDSFEDSDTSCDWEICQLGYVLRSALRLVRFYILEIYPVASGKSLKCSTQECTKIVLTIDTIKQMLKSFLTDNIINSALQNKDPLRLIASEIHCSFVACFHVFYPTPELKWNILSELLDKTRKISGSFENNEKLLAAVIDSLCDCRERLQVTLPSLFNLQENFEQGNSPQLAGRSTEINGIVGDATYPSTDHSEKRQHSLLVQHMMKSQIFDQRPGRVVVERLLFIATWPIRLSLDKQRPMWSNQLITYACRLLGRIIEEMVSIVASNQGTESNINRVILHTPMRFASTSQNRTWNTGNGSPDAICFTVDRPNISIAGACLFGGCGVYTYELELLELMQNAGDAVQSLTWQSLAVVKGIYGSEEFCQEIAEIKFERPVPIKENTRYTLRLRNQGGKTYSGDGGMTTVKGPDGTAFHFSACLLSFNGTNHLRGQLPSLLYCNTPRTTEVSVGNRSATDIQTRKNVVSILSLILRCTSELLASARTLSIQQSLPIICESYFLSHLVPFALANIGIIADSDPRSSVQILDLVKTLLPHVSALSLDHIVSSKKCKDYILSQETARETSSSRILVIESEHPYKVSTVTQYKASFPESVQWMCIDFDSQCCTNQPEDSLQIYLPTKGSGTSPRSFWPVLTKFGGTDNWPKASIILPGNEAVFCLESASDYARNNRVAAWGFRCIVIGYEPQAELNSILKLERELALIGGMCAASLMRKDLAPPSQDGNESASCTVKDIAKTGTAIHRTLLQKGLAFARAPSVHDALEGKLPHRVNGKERQFLRDFISASDQTSGGRLARWLQPDSVVDTSKSELIFPMLLPSNNDSLRPAGSPDISSPSSGSSSIRTRSSGETSRTFGDAAFPGMTRRPSNDSLKIISEVPRVGWPCALTFVTRDQFSRLVCVPNLQIEVRASPCSRPPSSTKTVTVLPRESIPESARPEQDTRVKDRKESLAFSTPYEVTVKEQMRLHAITFSKAYENYSFEEMRFMHPSTRRNSETMEVRSNNDGTYTIKWTPGAAGYYTIHVTVDGQPLDEAYMVHVEDPPQGFVPPPSNSTNRMYPVPARRVRQFRARQSAGLRIRAQPSLQGEQIGIVACNGIVSFIEELCNDDGTWVRLSAESVREWCRDQRSEAWCLQYNQHLNKTLLFPVANEGEVNGSQECSRTFPPEELGEADSQPKTYYVVDCGASGHNIRSQPNLQALLVGKLKLGSSFLVAEQRQTPEGLWVKLLPSSAQHYCGEMGSTGAWSLAMDKHQMVYLRQEDEILSVEAEARRSPKTSLSAKTAQIAPVPDALNEVPYPSARQQPPLASSEIAAPEDVRFSDRASTKGDDSSRAKDVEEKGAPESSQTAERQRNTKSVGRLSVFQNWFRQDGSQKPEQPPVCSRAIPPELRGVSVKNMVKVLGESKINGNSSMLFSENGQPNRSLSAHTPREFETSASVAIDSEITSRSRSLSPGGVASAKLLKHVPHEKLKAKGQSATPEPSNTKPDRETIVLEREKHQSKDGTTRRERSSRPAARCRNTPSTFAHQNSRLPADQEKPVSGISPSTAESLRAVFAATLWHQDLVHDAMACASFLKFHPDLPKERNSAILRQNRNRESCDSRARQRRSVEIPSNYVSPFFTAPAEEKSVKAEESAANHSDESGAAKNTNSLTPTLTLLVQLWETISKISFDMINAEKEAQPEDEQRSRKPSAKDNSAWDDAERRPKYRKDKSRVDSNCELCDGTFPLPVTAHMRQAHPGCQKPALGLGYNPEGQYCGGWVGNCGEGGVQDSSWYLLCEYCRHRYLKQKYRVAEASDEPIDPGKQAPRTSAHHQLNRDARTESALETQNRIKENALFLLQLTGSSDSETKQVSTSNRRKTQGPQPFLESVAEYASNQTDRSLQRSPGQFKEVATIGSDRNDLPPWMYFQCRAAFSPGYEPNTCRSPVYLGERESELSAELMDSFQKRADELADTGGRQLQRSVSMIAQPLAQNLKPFQEQGIDGGLALLRSPSKALEEAVKMAATWSKNATAASSSCLPVLDFIQQRHDLTELLTAMENASKKAAFRIYAIQSMTWMLQTATQPVCIHDLLWCLISSLGSPEEVDDKDKASNKKANNPKERASDSTSKKESLIGQHPTSDVELAGSGLALLLQAFQRLLQTVSDLMQLLPMGSPLLTLAVRCWDVNFKPSDHAFLHKSHVFSNISRILSRCEEDAPVDIELKECNADRLYVSAEVGDGVECKVSSRSAMVSSLFDGSTETFWESGDEDRGKVKTITLTIDKDKCKGSLSTVCIYVDNARDSGAKVSEITFKAGPTADELHVFEVFDVENRFTGWLHANLPLRSVQTIQLELRGPDNSLRVRQVRALGHGACRSFDPLAINQQVCENETLRVFRLLTSQVFGRLISKDDDLSAPQAKHQQPLPPPIAEDADRDEDTRDIDLKEHMVGILFSGKKLTALTHLQRQVCSHILHGIRKEANRLREEWESGLHLESEDTKSCTVSDSYCFELLSQVLALSGSRVGRSYISQQTGLLKNLLSLLHTGSPRIQRQVTALLRRMLPELEPSVFAGLVDVDTLPDPAYGILQILNSPSNGDRLLDVLLACVAKSLTLQVKNRGGEKDVNRIFSAPVSMKSMSGDSQFVECLGARWWMKGSVTRCVAEGIIQLVKDLASGVISEAWSQVTKATIAEAVLAIARFSDHLRVQEECLRQPSLWLALAALCLLEKEHVDRLTSTQWTGGSSNKPVCVNHDDGETGAQIVCIECGPLCVDCDRVLHLPRKSRGHQRQVCKEEEEAIKVDVHEGCGRIKLFWILALSDARTLKSHIEFRRSYLGLIGAPGSFVVDPSFAAAAVAGQASVHHLGAQFESHLSTCRYCGTILSDKSDLAFKDGQVITCDEAACQEHARNACNKILQCGHPCCGVRGELNCLPCLFGCSSSDVLKQDGDDMCMICFTEALSAAPTIQLSCSHVFHAHCCQTVLNRKWPGPRITFSFARCPICKVDMQHDHLADLLAPIRDLYEDVRRKALMRLEYEGLHQTEALSLPGSRFYKDAEGYAMERYAYYVCYKCHKAYYGGEARCEEALGEGFSEAFNPAELVCGGCSDVSRAQMCPRHGADYLEYKCRYCCSVAVFFCFGTTHFCNACHEDFRHVTELPKHLLPTCPAGARGRQLEGVECPLHLDHPPTGEEFALGCGICRNAHTF